jgi:hypothetical protein
MIIQQLNKQQMYWADILSCFNYKLYYWPGKLAGRPDALSCHEQDMSTGADDDWLKLREYWLFDPDTTFDNLQKAAHFYQTFTSPAQITAADNLRKLPLEEHWAYAEQHDKQLMEAKAAVENGAAKFLSNLQLRLLISEYLILPNR